LGVRQEGAYRSRRLTAIRIYTEYTLGKVTFNTHEVFNSGVDQARQATRTLDIDQLQPVDIGGIGSGDPSHLRSDDE